MPLLNLQTSFGRVFRQRCFYLFLSLIFLIVAAPFSSEVEHGRLLIHVLQVFVLIAATAAIGREGMPFVIALLLGGSALGFAFIAIVMQDDPSHNFAISAGFYLAFYLVAVVYLLRYVFSPQVMTDDKLFGAACGYLMVGVSWAYAYYMVQYFNPNAFGISPSGEKRTFYELLYMSFGCLTSNGPGDLIPTTNKLRSLVIIEQLSGTLFVAILIARLAGIYPPKHETEP